MPTSHQQQRSNRNKTTNNSNNNKRTIDAMMMEGNDREPAAAKEEDEGGGEEESSWAIFRKRYPFMTDYVILIKKKHRELSTIYAEKGKPVPSWNLKACIAAEHYRTVGGDELIDKFYSNPQIVTDALKILEGGVLDENETTIACEFKSRYKDPLGQVQ
jgi:hypothetical protein